MIGWTYEANATAVQEAQRNLDKLEAEQNAENIQYEIDLLEQAKSLLENIEENNNYEALKQVFDKFVKLPTFPEGTNLGDMIVGFFKEANLQESLKQGVREALQENPRGLISETIAEKESGLIETRDKLKNASESLDSPNLSYDEFLSNATNYNMLLSQYQAGLTDLLSTSGYTENLLTNSDIKQDIERNKEIQGYTPVDLSPITSVVNSQEEIRNKILNGKFLGLDMTRIYDINKQRYINLDSMFNSENGSMFSVSSQNGMDWLLIGKIKDNAFISEYGYYYDWGGPDFNHFQQNFLGVSSLLSNISKYANGSINTNSGPALVNEAGLEGIVTPSGTFTVLDQGTGVIRADMTKNLYALGQESPNLVKRLGDINVLKSIIETSEISDGIKVKNLYMSHEINENFDMNRFLMGARAIAASSNS